MYSASAKKPTKVTTRNTENFYVQFYFQSEFIWLSYQQDLILLFEYFSK